LDQAEAELAALNTKASLGWAEMQAQAESILRRRSVTDLRTLQGQETVTTQLRCVGPGRPGPDHPKQAIEIRRTQVTYHRNIAAIEEQQQLAGWRIHVTKAPLSRMTLQQALDYYRDEFLVELGFHRFKRGCLPAQSLFVRLPEHSAGLRRWLMIALQLLTLPKFVAQRELAQRQETLAGLEPSQPKMQTGSSSAERLLAQFDGVHFVVEPIETHRIGHIFESLALVQRRILGLLNVPESVYRIGFRVPVRNCFDSLSYERKSSCHQARFAIELDGSQHAEPEQARYDAEHTRVLAGEGIRPLRFWNNDVLKHVNTATVMRTLVVITA